MEAALLFSRSGLGCRQSPCSLSLSWNIFWALGPDQSLAQWCPQHPLKPDLNMSILSIWPSLSSILFRFPSMQLQLQAHCAVAFALSTSPPWTLSPPAASQFPLILWGGALISPSLRTIHSVPGESWSPSVSLAFAGHLCYTVYYMVWEFSICICSISHLGAREAMSYGVGSHLVQCSSTADLNGYRWLNGGKLCVNPCQIQRVPRVLWYE